LLAQRMADAKATKSVDGQRDRVEAELANWQASTRQAPSGPTLMAVARSEGWWVSAARRRAV
jgi:hypothetical protein